MAYKPKTWRDSQGEPRDPLTDTVTGIKWRAEKHNATDHEHLSEILKEQAKFAVLLVKDHTSLRERVVQLESTLKIVMIITGAVGISMLGGLITLAIKGLGRH